MIVCTANDSSEGEEKNPYLSKDVNWFIFPEYCIPPEARGE